MPDMYPTLLLTRPRPQAERFAARCRARLGEDMRIVISPVLSIRHRGQPVDLGGVAGVIVTSENGVRALAAHTDVAGVTAFCVGDHTAEVAEQAGMAAISAGGAVADLIALVAGAHPEGDLVYVRGETARGDVADALAQAGIAVRSRVLYDQVPAGLSDAAKSLLMQGSDVIAPLFSPRSAVLLGDAAQGAVARLALVALSPAVAAAWSGPAPHSMAIAKAPTAAAMMGKIATIYTAKLP